MLQSGGRNALVIPKGRAAIIDIDDPAAAVTLANAGMPPGFRVTSPTAGHGHFYVWQNGVELPTSFAGGDVRRGGSGMVLGPWALRKDGTYTANNVQVIPELPAPVAEVILTLRRAKQEREGKARGPADEGWQIVHGRHDYLVRQARRMRGDGLTGERLETELLRLRDERCAAPGGRLIEDREVAFIAGWATTNIDDDPPDIRINIGQAPSVRLPEAFSTARPYLAQIRQAARSRQRAPDAVLGAVLARVAALCPYTLGLPAMVGTAAGLSLLAAIIALPGAGKSGAAAIAREMVPGDLVEIPSGSGEGFVETFFETVEIFDANGKPKKEKRQVHHNVFCYIDEGQRASRQAAQASSTLFSTWRSVFTGGLLGESNASAERRRILSAGSYSAGIVAAFQPETLEPLFADLGVGTPQRFLYLSGTDPTLPDDPPRWPGALEPLSFDLESRAHFFRHPSSPRRRARLGRGRYPPRRPAPATWRGRHRPMGGAPEPAAAEGGGAAGDPRRAAPRDRGGLAPRRSRGRCVGRRPQASASDY